MKLNCGNRNQISGYLGRQELAGDRALWEIMSLGGSQFVCMCELTGNTISEQFAACKMLQFNQM